MAQHSRTSRRSPLVTVIIKAMEKAARPMLRDFGELENLQVSRKGPADFVSVADTRSEKILKEELLLARPTFGFLGEESGETKGTSESRFVVDPIDGTTNFLHGIPQFCISIAVETNGEIVAGVIHDPVKQETFWAEKGEGAFMNDKRLRVSGRMYLNEALLTTGIPCGERGNAKRVLKVLDAMYPQIAGIRRMGSAALDLAYVAAGRCDAYWEEDVKIWDIAAGILIVKEAGGVVTDSQGGNTVLQTGSVLATNFNLHGEFLKFVK